MTIIVFVLLAFGPLLVDMYHRRDGVVSLKTAGIWSSVYVSSALLFALFLLMHDGKDSASRFVSGWAIEKSLSIDNLLVFGAIFVYFGIQPKLQYRVLHMGIIGSVFLRLLFVSAGLFMFFVFGRLLDIVFGIFVIITAAKIETDGDGPVPDIDHNQRWYIRWTKRFLPVSPDPSEKFFVRTSRWSLKAVPTATPMFLCLIAIEITDIMFAFDSVPAVIGITKSTMLSYAAIMFAVIGLRSLYFVLDALTRYTVYLQSAIMIVLMIVGLKLIVHGVTGWEMPQWITFACVCAAVVYAVLFSLFIPKKPLPRVV